MKIGFDVSQTGDNKAGCGVFTENLICHLAIEDSRNKYLLYPTFGNHFWDDKFRTTCSFQLNNFSQGIYHANLSDAKNFWQRKPYEIESDLDGIDILHSNNFFCPPKLDNIKLVYTLYDLSFLTHPEYSTEENRLACFDGVLNASMNADFIIAISKYSREHFLKIFPHYPAHRIGVAYPGCRFDTNVTVEPSIRLKRFTSNKFWLNVGTLEPRKNIVRLIKAYANLLKQHPHAHPLVLAGQQGWLDSNIAKLIDKLKLASKIIILGYVNTIELQWLYQNAYCMVYPSLFEGFGMPVLEAMSYGTPVITSNVSSLPEVCGNAGILIDPTNQDSIQQAMLDLLLKPDWNEELKILSLQQSQKFSWKKSAQKVLSFYEHVNSVEVETKIDTKLDSLVIPELIR